MATIGTLTADLQLQSAAFIRDLGRAQAAVASNTAKMAKAMRAVQTTAAGVERQFRSFRSAAAGLAGALAVRQFVTFAKSALDTADAIAKTADSIGLSTDALQQFRVAAGLSGVGAEKFDKAVQKFTKNLGDAREGTGTLVSLLKDSDPAFLRMIQTSSDTEQALNLFLAKLAQAPDVFSRNSLAAAAFGREGIALTGVLSDGVKGLEDMRRKAVEIGAVLEAHLIKKAEEVNDRMELLQRVFAVGFSRSVILEFADSFQLTEENLQAARVAGEEFGRVVGVTLKGVAAVTVFAAQNIKALATALAGLIALKAAAFFIGLGGAVLKFTQATIAAVKATSLLNTVLSKSVLGVVAKLAIALGAGYLTWQAFGEGAMKSADAIEAATKRIEGSIGGAGISGPIKAATKALNDQTTANQALAAALQVSQAEYLRVKDNVEIANEVIQRNIDLTSKQGQEWLKAFEAARDSGRVVDEIKKVQSATEELGIAQMQAQAASIFNPEERRKAEVVIERQREINRLTEEYGTVASGTGQKLLALWDQTSTAQEQARTAAERTNNLYTELSGLADRAFDRIGSAVTEMFTRGEGAAVSFKNIALGIVSEIYQAFIKLAIVNPIKNAIFGGNSATLGGLLSIGSNFLGFGGAGSFGLGTPTATIHTGMKAGHSPTNFRTVNPAVFANAPRLHDGLMADEFPAILQKGEAVIPRGGNREGGSMTVYIDATGADAAAIARLESGFRQLDASIERRSVTAMVTERQRNPRIFGTGRG